VLMVNVAVENAPAPNTTDAVPRVVVPSNRVTVPLGGAVPANAVTVAVMVMFWFCSAGLGAALRAVDVGLRLTTSTTGPADAAW